MHVRARRPGVERKARTRKGQHARDRNLLGGESLADPACGRDATFPGNYCTVRPY